MRKLIKIFKNLQPERKKGIKLPHEVLADSMLGTIQVLRHQRGGWVGSENGNF